MMKLKLITTALLTFVFFAFGMANAQTAAPKKPATHTSSFAAAPQSTQKKAALPTMEEVEASMKRTFGYDPGVTWQIYDIKESSIPGLAEILVSMNKQQPVHLFLVPGTQTAIAGQMIPFGPDPFAAARANLKGAFGPSRGGQNPPIEIIEFSDLECPHCKVAQPVLAKLFADFPQLRFIFQQFPLPASMHPWALKAAQYADCAGQMDKDAFWKYVDSIFENQGGIALATADDKLKELATGVGLDAQKISTCAASPETDARIKKSQALGATLEVNETPTVFINGRRVPGIANIPYENLKQLVQFEIDHAGK
ncbi:MAG TPA: thioredoxin domain-containing protein [Candidatus Angelobacter sp.]|nr:thioredoxin domain-containing protein [Candidatus Angelobacter sp.]